jgi:hypothetical protein
MFMDQEESFQHAETDLYLFCISLAYDSILKIMFSVCVCAYVCMLYPE